MKTEGIIYTEKNNCQDCYKCIRHCPMKAIKIEDANASIISDKCIYCGNCVAVCPADAKKVRNDLSKAKQLIKTRKKVIAALAPSYLSEFPEIGTKGLIKALKNIGFYGVSETALGAEIVSQQTKIWLDNQPDGVYYSSCCPTVVELIGKYHPNEKSNLAPVLSPMQSHSKFLKSYYGSSTVVIFFGPCFAKKTELEQNPGLTDVVLTYQDLEQWLNEDKAYLPTNETKENQTFIPFPASEGANYPVEGGMLSGIKNDISVTNCSFMSFSEINNLREILEKSDSLKSHGKLFLELMACDGGCINGPGKIKKNSLALKRHQILNNHKTKENTAHLNSNLIFKTDFDQIKAVEKLRFAEDKLNQTLKEFGKFSMEDELNCGGCGYDSCRDFAQAMLEGKAERTMCVSYMRNVAQNKATVLLQKIPYGVVMVDDKLSIIDSNRKFSDLVLDEENKFLFDIKPGLHGADLRKLIPFHKLFSSVLLSGEEMIEQDIRQNNQLFSLSIITIQSNKIVCGIIRNMKEQDIRPDIVKERTQKVIKQNMKIVQKIAYLLGENASFTESMLNSIQDAHEDKK